MKKITSIVFILALVDSSFHAQSISRATGSSKAIHFKENKGQISDQYYKARPDILFSGTEGELVFHLKNNGISYQLNRVDEWAKKENRPFRNDNAEQLVPAKSTIYRVDINWLNANTSAEIIKGTAEQGYENYYLESCPNGALDVKSYADVTYKNLYNGIDLKWYEKNGSLEYDYYLAANADYTKIQLEYKGAEKIYIDATGSLIIKTPLGIIKEQKPLVLQNNKTLSANWIVKNNSVSFDIKNVNKSLPLIIDPTVRLWSTYYGGIGQEQIYYTYANMVGDVYISGMTASSANIATSGAHQTAYGGGSNTGDGFLVKFSPTGARLWATYYGGSGDDYACESIEDPNGNVFMTGGTSSGSSGVIATPGAHQTVYSTATTNTSDAFLVLFNSSGFRQWGTYCGGSNEDFGNGISLDNIGNVFISGGTQSTDNIATLGSNQFTLGGGLDCFLVKFNSVGTRQWGTYIGGNGTDVSSDCLTNSAGETYLSGSTSSSAGIATPGSHQAVFGGGISSATDAILAKFNSAGTLQWSTYYGGNGTESVNKIALDSNGDLYCAGWTTSSSASIIATPGSHQSTFGGGVDAMLVKFNPLGIRQWGTYYGGTGQDYGGGTTIDALGNLYLSGDANTNTGTTIATPCAYQSQYAGGSFDGYLAKFTNTGQRLWGTYYGSIYTEYSYCSCADGHGNVYITGFTYANSGTVMASSNGYQPSFGGGIDGYLVKFDGCVSGNAVNTTPPANRLVCPGNSATLSATCGNWYSSPTSTNILSSGDTFTTGIITSDSTFYVEDFGCGSISGPRTAVSVTLVPSPSISVIANNPTPCLGETILFTANGGSTYSWSFTLATTPTVQVNVISNIYLSVIGTDTNGCSATASMVIIPNLCLGLNGEGIVNTSLSVFPNPNNGQFTIQSSSDIALIVTNELGQTIQNSLLNKANNYTLKIDNLANGVYFLVGEKDSRVFNKKIVVIH